MPRKNTNARPRRGTSTLQAVPRPGPASGGRSGAEDKLRAALAAHPGTTTAELADHAGIGRSTAGKLLAAWERDDSATRTPGPAHGTRKTADTWTVTDQPSSSTEDDDGTTTSSPAPGQPVPIPAGDTAAPKPTAGLEPGTAPPAATQDKARDTAAATPSPRLGKGALQGLVEDYLTEHAGEQVSPNALAKALGRSSGAVANALERLVTTGYAVRTQARPKRYAAKTS